MGFIMEVGETQESEIENHLPREMKVVTLLCFQGYKNFRNRVKELQLKIIPADTMNTLIATTLMLLVSVVAGDSPYSYENTYDPGYTSNEVVNYEVPKWHTPPPASRSPLSILLNNIFGGGIRERQFGGFPIGALLAVGGVSIFDEINPFGTAA